MFSGDEPNYLVVDTDYENYSVVFSCNEIAPFVNIRTYASYVKLSNAMCKNLKNVVIIVLECFKSIS